MWTCKRARKATARSQILELMECSVVKAYAPTFILKELNIHIPRLAKEESINEVEMHKHWERFKAKVTLIEVGEPPTESDPAVRGPKDLPYIRLQQKLNAPIYTEDKDLLGMGARVIQIQLFGPLRTYSRNAAVEYHIKVTGIGSAMILSILATSLLKGAKSAASGLSKIPKPFLYIGIGLVILAILHPASRKKITELLDRVLEGSKEALSMGWQMIEPIMNEHNAAQTTARSELKKAGEILEQRKTARAPN